MATSKTTKTTATKKPVVKKVTDGEKIDVKSCRMGKLTWISKKTGYKLIWDEFGAVNPMSVEELREMRNGDKKFFEDNWVMLEGDRAPVILDYLGISKFYKDMSGLEDIDEIFEKDPDEIVKILKSANRGFKELVARRAASLKEDGSIDSIKIVEAVEKATGFSIEV